MADLIPPQFFGLSSLGDLGQTIGQVISNVQKRKEEQEDRELQRILARLQVEGVTPGTQVAYQQHFGPGAGAPIQQPAQINARAYAEAVQAMEEGTATPGQLQMVFQQQLGSRVSPETFERATAADVRGAEAGAARTEQLVDINKQIAQGAQTWAQENPDLIPEHLQDVGGFGLMKFRELMRGATADELAADRLRLAERGVDLDERRLNAQLRRWNAETEALKNQASPEDAALLDYFEKIAPTVGVDPVTLFKYRAGEPLTEVQKAQIREHYLPWQEASKAEIRAEHLKNLREGDDRAQKYNQALALLEAEKLDEETFTAIAEDYIRNSLLEGLPVEVKGTTGWFGRGSPVFGIVEEALGAVGTVDEIPIRASYPESLRTPINPETAASLAEVIAQQYPTGVPDELRQRWSGVYSNPETLDAAIDVAYQAQEATAAEANQVPIEDLKRQRRGLIEQYRQMQRNNADRQDLRRIQEKVRELTIEIREREGAE